MANKKIGKLTNDKLKAFYPEFKPEPHVVVFGSQRIGAIYALRTGINPRRVILATSGVEGLRGVTGEVIVVRVPETHWQPTTHACERRVKETEQTLKALAEAGEITITEDRLH